MLRAPFPAPVQVGQGWSRQVKAGEVGGSRLVFGGEGGQIGGMSHRIHFLPSSVWPRAGGWLAVWVAGLWLGVAGVRAAGPAGVPGDYLIDVWSGENGLLNSSVTAVAQTPDGYLWVGTYNGLARFDGVRFENYDPFTTPELPHARVRRLFVDEAGTLWVNLFDGSLVSYRDDRAGKFKLEWKGDDSADAWVTAVSLRRDRLMFLLHTGELITRPAGGKDWQTLQPPGFSSGELAVEDGHGTVWCRGRDQKLWRYDGTDFQPVPAGPEWQGQNLNCLVTDRAGRLWLGTDQKLLQWNGTQFSDETPTNGEAGLNIAFVQFMADGEAWVFANERARKARGREWVAEPAECRGIFTGRLDRLGVQEDQAGGTWIYHYGRGLFHVRADGRTRQVATEENFPGERVDCFFEDREGNLWAGVDRGGLVRLREKRFTVLQPNNDVTTKATVSVAEDGHGAIWVGTFGAGLYRYQGNEWKSFPLPGDAARGFVFSVFPAGPDKLWVSAGDEDLYSLQQGRFQAVNPPVHGIKSLLLARDGRLWIGTKSGLYGATADNPDTYLPVSGVDRVDIRSLVEDRAGRIWAGGGNGTLYCLETNTVQHTELMAVAGTNAAGAGPGTNRVSWYRSEGMMASQPIWSLLVDGDGTLWAGTFRGGLLRFRDGKFTRITSKDGLPDDVICQLLDDGAGQLWAGSQKGIFRMAKAELNAFAQGLTKSVDCTAYGRFDGLPSLECSGNYQPACWRAADGRLLFTTLKGVVSVQPTGMQPNRMPPPVFIEAALVDGEAQNLGHVLHRGRGLAAGVSLEVAPGKRQLEVRYTGLSFVSPDRVRFRYRLVGLEKDWVEAGTRRTAQYSFLRPGNYTFQVIACNNDGVWDRQSAELWVTVRPHFYETAWFSVVVSLGVMGLVVITVRQVVMRKMRRQLEFVERQRAVERDRTRIAKDIHDDLGAGLTHISLLTELARRTPPEEANAHLGQISDMARELTRGMDEIVWAVDPQNDTLDGLLNYLCKFAQEYLSVAGIRCRLDLPAQMPPWGLRAEIRHNLFLAFKEALNNIVKHAGATEVWLKLDLGREEFTLTIEDNGRGLTPGNREKEPDSASSSGRISSGRGLGNLEKRLASIGGRCVVTGQPEKGTRIEMTVNLARVIT